MRPADPRAVRAALCCSCCCRWGWLVVFAFSDRKVTRRSQLPVLFTDSSFVDPLVTALGLAVSVSVICCVVAAPMGYIVARTDMPLRRAVRVLGDGVVRDPAVPRRNRLGAARRPETVGS